MTRFEPMRSSSRPPSAAPNGAGDGEDDAEQAELGRAPAEHRRGIDAAEGEHGAEPVGIEHARDEEERDLAVIADEVLARAWTSCLSPALTARAERLGRGPVRREQEERQDEHEIPERRERSDQPVAFARRGIERDERREPEQGLAGLRIGNEQSQHQERGSPARRHSPSPSRCPTTCRALRSRRATASWRC